MKTQAELQVLKDIEAAQARGEDVFGDDEEIVAEGSDTEIEDQDDAEDALPTDAEDASLTDVASKVEDAPKGESPANQPKESAQPIAFKVDAPKAYKEQRAELLKAKAEAMKNLMDGEIDAETFAAAESEIADKLEDLTAARIRAETLQEANVQNQQAYQGREIQKLIRATRTQVDYTKDVQAAKQFDRALAVIGADPENADADYAEMIAEAHEMVLAIRGLRAPASAPAVPGMRKPGVDAPVTLRSLPAAATPNSNGGVLEQLSRMKGAAYEAAFQKLSPAQRAELLDESTGD